MHNVTQRLPKLAARFAQLRRSAGLGEAEVPSMTSYTAADCLLGRSVILRVITNKAADYERDLFEREAEALSRIGEHACVVSLLDRVRVGGSDVLVLQHGRPRGEGRGAMAPAEALRIVGALAGGVEWAHERGLVHGSIESAAVLFDEAKPLLAGFRHRLDDPRPPVLRAVGACTPPELLLGERITEAADVYGLGAVLFELIAGRPAIRHAPGDTVAARSLRVLAGVDGRAAVRQLPVELAELITWTLAVEPAERPPSAAWLAEELGRLAGHSLA